MYAARIQMILGFAEREHHPSGFGFVDWSNVEVKNDQGDGFKLRERVSVYLGAWRRRVCAYV